MHKDEIIQLHTLFVQIKEEIERELSNNSIFEEYKALGIYPQHVHKSKDEHKKAIFTLGKEIASVFSTNKYSGPDRVAMRLARMGMKIGQKP